MRGCEGVPKSLKFDFGTSPVILQVNGVPKDEIRRRVGYMSQAFPAHLRYSGISLAYQLICALAGGSTPIIGTLLAGGFAGQWMPLALFFTALSALSLIGVCGLARLRGEIEQPSAVIAR